MRFFFITSLLFLSSLCYFPAKVVAQLTVNDSVVFQASIKNALSVYHNFMPNPSGLYNGGQYISYAHLIRDNHPYFQSDTLNTGTITYDSVLYENVPLLYDIVKEQVVINDPFKIYKISLINEKVNEFSVLGRNFIRLIRDSANRIILTTGFYDRLYQGSINLYEKEIKKMQEVIVSQELQRIIYPVNDFYLEIAGKFYSINHKKTLLNLLKNRRKEIQQFIRKNKLSYRRDKENTLLKVVKYYDELQGIGTKK